MSSSIDCEMVPVGYVEKLEEFQTELLSAVQLTEHLLDSLVDSGEEWKQGGAWLMSRKLRQLAEGVPFPGGVRC